MAALVWLLWPADYKDVLDPEPLFVFSVGTRGLGFF